MVLDFLDGIMAVAGVENTASFTRSYVVNTQEEVTTVIQAAPHLTDDYVTTKILTLFGDGDQAEAILDEKDAESMARFNEPTDDEDENEENNPNEEDNPSEE